MDFTNLSKELQQELENIRRAKLAIHRKAQTVRHGDRHIIIYFSDAEALEQSLEEYDNEEQTREQQLTFSNSRRIRNRIAIL